MISKQWTDCCCSASGFPFQVHAVAAVACAADCTAAECHQPHCWQLDLVPHQPLSNSVPTLLPTNFSRQLLLLFCPIDAFDGACLGSINSSFDAASTPAIFTFL